MNSPLRVVDGGIQTATSVLDNPTSGSHLPSSTPGFMDRYTLVNVPTPATQSNLSGIFKKV